MIFAQNSYSRLFFQNFPTEILISSKNIFIKVHTTLQDRCLCWGIFLKLGKLGGCVDHWLLIFWFPFLVHAVHYGPKKLQKIKHWVNHSLWLSVNQNERRTKISHNSFERRKHAYIWIMKLHLPQRRIMIWYLISALPTPWSQYTKNNLILLCSYFAIRRMKWIRKQDNVSPNEIKGESDTKDRSTIVQDSPI